jgi:hypothetical protein
MTDPHATIERLLAGLRDAEPSAGMQRRILQAIEAREAIAPGSPWRRPILPWLLRPAIAASLVCALVMAAYLIGSFIVTITVRQHHHVQAELRTHAASADARQATVAHKLPLMPRRTASRAAMRPPPTQNVPAVEATQTASSPAPPLPLTEQEKLLLRLAHRRDAQNMVILNPDAQAAQSAKATEQFQQFFAINPAEMRSESE